MDVNCNVMLLSVAPQLFCFDSDSIITTLVLHPTSPLSPPKMAAKQLPNQSGSMPNMPIPETPYGAAKEK